MNTMCNLGEGVWEEAHAEELAAGRADMIQKMLKNGMTPEEVADITEFSVEEVEKMKNTETRWEDTL